MAAPAVVTRFTGPEATLRRHLRREVRAYSPFWREVIDRAGGLGAGDSSPLARLPVTRVADVDDWGALVLRPSPATIASDGRRSLALRLAWARIFGQQARFGRRVVDPAYKPLHWLAEKGTLLGYSAGDMGNLAELGRRWLEDAGVQQDDVVVSLVSPGPRLGYWQLVLGARRAGLSAIHLPPTARGAEIASLHPTVLAGSADDVVAALTTATESGVPLGLVRTVLIVDEVPDVDTRRRIRHALPSADAAVVAAWAPPGGRSLWAECRGGTQLHTDPAGDVVEVVDGELVVTSLGWTGTALLRWGTGVAGAALEGPCPACGKRGVRVTVGEEAEPAASSASAAAPAPLTPSAPLAVATVEQITASVLDAEAAVVWWDVDELASGTGRVVIIGVEDPEICEPLVRRLDVALGDVAQFVVVSAQETDESEGLVGAAR